MLIASEFGAVVAAKGTMKVGGAGVVECALQRQYSEIAFVAQDGVVGGGGGGELIFAFGAMVIFSEIAATHAQYVGGGEGCENGAENHFRHSSANMKQN